MTVVAPTRGLVDEPSATAANGGTFFGVLAGVSRPFREPGRLIFDPLPAGAPCCVPVFDSNPERIRVPTFVLQGSTPIDAAAGASIANLSGILDYNSRTYSLLPDNAMTPSIVDATAAQPVSAPGAGEATVASFNMERFYDTADDPAVADVALTPAGFERRLSKASLAVRNVLKTPDILAVVEMENLATLQTLAARINADAVAAGQPSPHYAAYLEEGNDPGGIDVGFLVKNDGRVKVLSVTQVGKAATFINPATGGSELLNDRPPLALRAVITEPGSALSLPLTVIANHLRSLNDAAAVNNTGVRVRAKRNAQAEYLAGLVQQIQTANPQERVVLAGDFNAFEFSDGLVDVMGAIKGTPAPADQVVQASQTVTSPPLTNLVESVPAAHRYSFSFDGSAQTLDHILVNGPALNSVLRMEFARSNADFPDALRNDAARPERLSDHDAAVAYFRLPVAKEINELVNVLALGTLNNPQATEAEGEIRIVNQSGAQINGPVYLFLENITPGVTLKNPDGYWNGTPYYLISAAGLAPGASKPVAVHISKPRGTRFEFTPKALSGTL
jgi:predicted extracellular nuclease